MAFTTAEEVIKYIADENIEYVDIRFSDLPASSSTSRSRRLLSTRTCSRTASHSTDLRSADSSRSTSPT